MEGFFKVGYSIVVTVFTLLFGVADTAIFILLFSIILDYITGIIKAVVKHRLSSNIGFTGILKKVGILLIVTVAVICDSLLNTSGTVRLFVIYYFVANELLSILENLGGSGVPIPKKLKKLILNFQEDNHKEDL